eukprot:Phypoly_transcript_04427.p1 GENE.Phypoly_transcript_04427~~Phypoly_transcript_04427.p1  ORF type:complete len:660 (+),score=152.47 Phypoly_transcript_04427:135-2114(+)
MNNKGKTWVATPDAERPIQFGTAYPANEPAITVPNWFKDKIEKYKHEKALSVKRDGVWLTWTYQQYYDQIIRFAKALIKIGLKPFETCSILGFNSPEWFMADVGTIFAGGIACGIYATNGPEACKYIIEHSTSSVVVVENEAQLKKILQVKAELPHIKAIVQYLGEVKPNSDSIFAWEQFLALGDDVPDADVQARVDAQKPTQACTLIYTSGTTGPPKAVMLSHDNLTWTALTLKESIQTTPSDIFISYLPLSHIAAQMSDIYAPATSGCSLYFAKPDALKGSLGETLKEVRPTIFLGVPRVWEKIMEKMIEIGKANPTILKYISAWARSVGLSGGYATQNKQPLPWGWWLANTLVFGKVRAALGLDRARLLGTSAAPISRECLDFFLSLNIPLYEIYGMSECTGPETATTPEHMKIGAAGYPMEGTELKIMNPDAEGNGEICWRGRSVFLGYMKNEEATAETIDGEGFLHSGDIGKLDQDGFLTITGRIKELIITAGGENVPPVLIEDEIKKEIGSVVSNVMVVGDRRKFLACLITLKTTPNPSAPEGTYPFTDDLNTNAVKTLEALGINCKTVQEAIKDKDLHKWITQGINAANKRATSNAQQVRKFAFLEKDFAIENDTLTPSMKLKRRVVVQQYGHVIDNMYEEAEREMAAAGGN